MVLEMNKLMAMLLFHLYTGWVLSQMNCLRRLTTSVMGISIIHSVIIVQTNLQKLIMSCIASGIDVIELQVKMTNFLIVFIMACNLTYQTYAIDEIQETRKLMNNSTLSPQLQSTNVQVHVHNHFNLTLAIALPIGAGAILSVLWAIYMLCKKKPTRQAEEPINKKPTQQAEEATQQVEEAINKKTQQAEEVVEIVTEYQSLQEVAEDITDIVENTTTQ